MKLSLMKNICLIGMIDNFTPSGLNLMDFTDY
jgi:hypothetical protein